MRTFMNTSLHIIWTPFLYRSSHLEVIYKKGIIELIYKVLIVCKVSSVLVERICQESLENCIGKHGYIGSSEAWKITHRPVTLVIMTAQFETKKHWSQ